VLEEDEVREEESRLNRTADRWVGMLGLGKVFSIGRAERR